jgi:hypothetical protein
MWKEGLSVKEESSKSSNSLKTLQESMTSPKNSKTLSSNNLTKGTVVPKKSISKPSTIEVFAGPTYSIGNKKFSSLFFFFGFLDFIFLTNFLFFFEFFL